MSTNQPTERPTDNGHDYFADSRTPKRLSPSELNDIKERYSHGSIYPSHVGAMDDAITLLAHVEASEALIIDLAAKKTLAEANAAAGATRGNRYIHWKPDVLNRHINGFLGNFIAALALGYVLRYVASALWHPVAFWPCVWAMFLLLVLKESGE